MSLQETKSLLKIHQIVPNKLLGQNFMVDSSVYPKLSKYSNLSNNDVVLDAGAGFGFLTRFLAGKCKEVVAVEKDLLVVAVLREEVKGLSNVSIVAGDVLKVDIPVFNKAISIPPYYLSSKLIVWLLDRGFDSAVLIVQKEFAERLVASVGSEEYGWLSVITNQGAKAELLDDVPKWEFYPQPEVDSVVLLLKPWETPPFTVINKPLFRRLTKWLFTQRNKKLCNAVIPFIKSDLRIGKREAAEMASGLMLQDKRVRELAPKDFGAISDALSK
jgi:16S rRNA (adenine1518-N6/adenine1519-N6)-dimethyltransferase